ncbi:low specificity L-threonine aldolase [Blastopirellula marina]|uniref:Low specificity L-threonine aldolase n=1 Tax=Blastopirellula marina TaxID=124 RepID=A0A2S8F3J1_9BACT|nr:MULTISPECIES: GntG family PLP-dependent aldolase [Pirellulaceae]PQO26703.1 low specificity L-threonine aldolase [Blastopirellula marina]RCS46182.1 aminotransferase class I/II-fold pyridoxal phosphate-dependent enzyme [Bremerella cremea]
MNYAIDLRSDTVTQPSPAMRQFMAQAEVGDAVIDIDPTTERLEKLTAEMLGKEAAIFMPSGSMTNQIAIRLHCQPGDEFLCEENCHVYNYEQAAFAQLSGVVARTLPGEHGVLQPEQFEGKVRPENDHLVRTKLVCLENTHNRGSGKVQPFDTVQKITSWAHASGLQTHLDGARLFNAAAATGISVADWSGMFDSVSVCFSKGLGAPVGSALAGPAEFIKQAKRARKLFGGGMRQSGIIAAGALYALQNNVARLSEDHEKAAKLAEAVRQTEGITLDVDPVETNIVIFSIDNELGTAAQLQAVLSERGVGVLSVAPQKIRMVTHLDVSMSQIDTAIEVIKQTLPALA